MKKVLKSESGFSLIELMVVVGIIGILASIAIPQFSKFQARARQSEVKTTMAGIYTAEKAFQVEWSQFYGSLRTVGYAPDGTNLRYNAGFTALGQAAPAGLTVSAADAAEFALSLGTPCNGAGGAQVVCPFAAVAPAQAIPAIGAPPTLTTFRLAAIGNPNNVNPPAAYDQWTIDDGKVIVNTTNGIQ